MDTYSSHIVKVLKRSYQIDISKFDTNFVNKIIGKRMVTTQCNTDLEYYIYLQQDQNEGREFLDSLHISYSEFFRNPLTFSILERIILPSLIQNKKASKQKEIRIWSAACAGGQEVYSLGMLLEELKDKDNNTLPYRIFASDQNESLIARARNGQYSSEAMNKLSLERVGQWFTKGTDTYSINPELKKDINFSVFDLLSRQFTCPPASIFGEFDLVICANLLYYYNSEGRKLILDKLSGCLAQGAFLVTGETERDFLLEQDCLEVFPQSGIFKTCKR